MDDHLLDIVEKGWLFGATNSRYTLSVPRGPHCVRWHCAFKPITL
jgi:hypothetical protein